MSPAPGAAALADLRAALLRLDLRLRLAVDSFRSEMAERARDPFRGLYISEADVDELLASAPSSDVASELLAGPASAIAPRLARLASLFELDAFQQEALLVCLAPELDLRYERLYGYLQDDVTKRRPTVDLLLRLLCPSLEEQMTARPSLSPSGRLLHEGLLALGDEAASQWPLLARPLRVDERVAEYFLGSDRPDPRITSFAGLFPPDCGAEAGPALEEQSASLVGLLRSDAEVTPDGPLIYLHGPPGSGKVTTARTVCRAAGRPLLLVDLPALINAGRPERGLMLAAHEAQLQNAVLAIDGFDRLLADEPDLAPVRNRLRELLGRPAEAMLLLGEARWEPAAWAPGRTAIRCETSGWGPLARHDLWRGRLDGELTAEEVDDLAARFHLDGDAIAAVVSSARSRAIWRGDGRITAADVRTAARTVAAPPLEGLARRLEPCYGWDDIVLAPDGLSQLRELCARVRHQGIVLERWGFGRKHARRAGLTALFAGQPGTGKTMAAEIVAGDLELDLYRIDLSAVVSKYIGETEKNLERIFRAADQGDAVLLFDEADALFGKRSEVRDAHDRYANVEIAYLLQRLETYEGLAILTTNLRGNIDEAFVRRLDCVVEFPMPEEAERLAIWRRALPPEAPLARDVDLPFLARRFKLAGGHIRNIALTGAFLAAEDGPITMRHLVQATRREYQKLGKLVAEADFEQYFELLKDRQADV